MKAAISSMTSELNSIRLSNATGGVENKKFDDLQTMFTGMSSRISALSGD